MLHIELKQSNPLSKLKLTPRPRVKWVNLGRFWGEVKKTKRSADEYCSFQIQECGSTTLETTLDAFCERSFQLAGCYKCGDIKVVHVDETIFHHNRKTAIITLYKPS